ncbi:MAG: hypothetical protein Q9160_005334 [Pyrenula sp. 1 TL-2023]
MKFSIAAAAAFAASVLAYPTAHLAKRDDALSVELTAGNGAEVLAKVTNTANEAVSLLNYGTFMDKSNVQKVNVYKDSDLVPFTGSFKNYMVGGSIPASDFTTLQPGESFTTTVDISALHEVADGEYTVDSDGAIPYAAADSTDLTGAATYASNKLTVKLSGVTARRAYEARRDADAELNGYALDKRVVLSSGCTGTIGTNTRTALTDAVSLSNAARSAATAGSTTTFNTYYRTTASGTRSRAASVFSSVSSQAGSTTSGSVTMYCNTDPYNDCGSNVLAYTIPSLSVVAICPLSYQQLPVLTRTCHAQDLTTTIIHEFTHALAGTQDYAYGYNAAIRLSAAQAVANADTYALYSNAIYVGC